MENGRGEGKKNPQGPFQLLTAVNNGFFLQEVQ